MGKRFDWSGLPMNLDILGREHKRMVESISEVEIRIMGRDEGASPV